MPRPYKTGLDYFPLDTDFFSNKKIKNLRRAHGSIGVLTYLNLLCRVYKNGYYYKFDDIEELSMDIAEEISCSQIRATATGVTETINYLVGRGILNQGLFERGIISGEALQEQYVLSTYKAKRNIRMDVHCLVDVGVVMEKNRVNSEETGVNSEETQVGSEKGTQSKVKENNTNSFTTTTTTPHAKDVQETLPPSYAEIYLYMKNEHGIQNSAEEAEKFEAYNASKGWTCLPNWRGAVDLWIVRGRQNETIH